MGMLLKSIARTMLILFTLYSVLNIIEIVESRFLWDLSSYCIDYCSRIHNRISPIGVCSCHRIASFNRRMTFDHLQSPFNEHLDTQQQENDI